VVAERARARTKMCGSRLVHVFMSYSACYISNVAAHPDWLLATAASKLAIAASNVLICNVGGWCQPIPPVVRTT
jgi:hypothetical protein